MGFPSKLEEHATTPLAGGIVNHGYQCGMIWAAALAAGAQAYRLHGPGPQAEAEAVIASQKIVESFRARNKNEINCMEISELNMQGEIQFKQILKFFIKGGPVGCVRMAVKYAPPAFNDINAALSEKQSETPSPPVSCAAMVAQKMGASEMHTVMAAGLAGGIGLSGGGCGALGTAIWINAMNDGREGAKAKDIFKRAGDMIEKFLKGPADFKFECEEIVGRKFEDVNDHASYLRDGGCAEIIELLATK